jgi:hypothetical protein
MKAGGTRSTAHKKFPLSIKHLCTQQISISACGDHWGLTRSSRPEAKPTPVGRMLRAAQALLHKTKANAINAIIIIIIIIINIIIIIITANEVFLVAELIQ